MTTWPVIAVVEVSAVIGMALVAAMLLRRRSAATRHWVLVVGVSAAIAVLPLSVLAGHWLPSSWRMARPGQASALGLVRRDALESAPRSGPAGAPRSTIDAVWAAAGTATQPRLVEGLWTLLLVVWVIGSVVSVAVLLAGLARLQWLTSQSALVTNGPWRQLADDVARRSGLCAPVRLVQSRHPALLATWGIRRPVILLPAGAETWMSDRIAIVLAHELAHVARWDWVVLVLASALRAAFWFNPLLWVVSGRLHRESELACDDQVLAFGTTGADYASHLCDLARLLRPARGRGLPVAPMTPAAQLQERIHAMLVPANDRRPVAATLRTTSLTVGLAATLFVAVAAAQSSFHRVAGVVRDATQRVLPSARLVLTHLGNQSKFEVRSNAEGHYEFVGLPAATYRLDVDVPGFAPVKAEWVVSATAVHDIQLEVASLQETMTVRDSASALPDPESLQKATLQFEALRTRALDVCANPARNAAVGGNIMPPKKLLHVQPVYAQSLRDAGVGGVVTMTATIGTDGLVRHVDDLTGPHPELASAAEQAVRQWQFSQTWLNCEAIDVRMRVTTNFVPQ